VGSLISGSQKSYSLSSHALTGLLMIVLVYFCAGMGYIMRYGFIFMEKHSTVGKYLRIFHSLTGYIILGIGQYETLSGLIDMFAEDFNYIQFLFFYGIWLLVLMTGIAIGEYRIYLQQVLPYNPKAKEAYKIQMKLKYAHLPEFTWKDISERVLMGNLWIMIDRVIYVR
jgi:hypothetical protein